MGFLVDHSKELETALLEPQNFDASAGGQWLAERYREIVPVILPDVLNCLDTGQPLTSESVAAVRGSAEAILTADVPLRTVLHGGIPALRVFTAFLQPHHSHLSTAELSTILGRASLVATELAACWAQTWSGSSPRHTPAAPRTRPPVSPGTESDYRDIEAGQDQSDDGDDTGGTPNPLDLVAVPGHLDSADLNMVLLAAQGHSNEEIAKATDYSSHAVKWHLGRAMRTWNARNRASLITTALLRGALRPRTRLTPPRGPNRP